MEVDETVERVETVEEPEKAKLSTTAVILAVTLLATISGGLAARADWRTSVEERERALRGATAQRAFQHLTQESADINDTNIVRTQAVVRARAAAEAARGEPAVRRYAEAWATVAARGAESPDEAAVTRDLREAVRAEQEGEEHAELVEEWTLREQANLGVAGLLAVALLLVGMSAAAHTRRSRMVFLVAGSVLAGYGALRVGLINRHEPRPAPAAAIDAYVDAVVALDDGDTDEAIVSLRHAVAVNPHYGAAWEALGDAYVGQADEKRTGPEAAEAYEHAVESGSSPTLLNNLAYAEALAGRGDDAVRHARAATRRLPEDVRTRTTLAEAYVAAGDRTAALGAVRDALDLFARQSRGLRDSFASEWRRDAVQMRRAGVGGALRDEVYGVLDRGAVTFDAFGSTAPRPQGPATLRETATSADSEALRLTIHVEASGRRPGDRVTVRVYRGGTDVVASATQAAGPRMTFDLAVDPGEYTVELYLNGSLVHTSTTSFS